MNRLIVLASICIFISLVQCVTYESYYDYSEEKEEEDSEFEEKGPIYDLKDAPKLFEKFIKDYNKEYKDKEEYNIHLKNFITNLKYINEVNSEGRSSSSDINMFTDLGDAEISKLFE